jgi:RNA polymerase sigma factor (sigma-70 family)
MEVSTLSHPSSIPGLRGPSALLRLQSDERLITLTRRGQHAAFEVLCARYQTRLLSFCRHMLASREDAEDVLQEVFAAAFNAVLADERDINVRPWLYRIARNRSLNHLRRASAIGVDSMDIHLAEGGISTSDKVMRRESFRELIGDVHQLPETQRTALLLREIDALSYEQIALAMDTTVPSVKSLLVRARISLAEAAESRKLSCDEVRLELGTVAEGLAKLSTPARRHVRGCERCSGFRKQLKDNNRALALILPVGPLLLVKKLLLAKVGSTASAGGAHVAGGAGAAATATAGAGAAAGGSVAGSIVTAGAGAIATKAVAGLAAAALLTAGVAAADHSPTHHHHARALAAAATSASASEPVVVHQAPQPITATVPAPSTPPPARHHHFLAKAAKPAVTAASPAATVGATTLAAAHTIAAPVPPGKPVDPQPVTETTTQSTELPASATTVPTGVTTTTTTTTTATPPTTPTPTVPGTPTGTTPGEAAVPPPITTPTTPAPAPEGSPGADGDADVLPASPSSGGTAAPPEEATGPVGAFSRIRRAIADGDRHARTADAR